MGTNNAAWHVDNGRVWHRFWAMASLATLAGLTACGGGDEAPTTKVYKNRGVIQCESTGMAPEVMQAQLDQVGIRVLSLACGSGPGGSVAACGAGTTDINIFEITERDVVRAQAVSFRLFSELLNPQFHPLDNGRETPCPA